jgi:trehalose-6-phosphate synthase
VGRINGTYGTLEDSPIHYINQSVPQNELFAIYKMADVCLVTSVRDGMNLVSHEYVVAQYQGGDEEGNDEGGGKGGAPGLERSGSGSQSASSGVSGGGGPGVLILSEFAGSAQSLSGAIRVNPWNTEEVATAIHTALTLSPIERSIRCVCV